MNEQQARFVRKLKAEAVMYFDIDNQDVGVKVHQFKDGKLKVKNFKVVEFIFSPDVGKDLCLKACSFFEEEPGDGWLDYSDKYEEVRAV